MLNLSQQIICLISCCILISICESAHHHERHIIHVPVFVHFVHHHHKIIQKRPRKGKGRFKGHGPPPHGRPPYKSPYRYSHGYSHHGHPLPPGAYRSLPVKHIRVPVHHHVSHAPIPRKPVKSVPKGKGFHHNHVHVYHAHPG
ncbi:uncharacterized protein [Bemisia tabaci]|nr:PREDICTED: histidine-rich glycoprotein-like isoform X2 [Bemisia tabaci]